MRLSIRNPLSTRHQWACHPSVLLATTIATLILAVSVESSPVDRTSVAHNTNAQRMVLIQAVIIVALNLVHIPCAYVVFKTIKQWRENTTCGMTSRIPLYIALSDSFVALSMTASVIYMAIDSHSPDSQICGLLSTLAIFALLLNMFLLASILWSTYVRVCHEVYLNFGKYDIRLLLGLFGAAALLSVLDDCASTIDDDDDGDGENPAQRILWCTSTLVTSIPSISSISMSSQMKAFALPAVLIVTVYCYCRIRRCIVGHVDHALLGANMSRRRFTLETRAMKKINFYLLMFLSKWVMVLAYVLGKVGLAPQDVVVVLILCCTALGAVLNIMQFSSNEFYRQLHEHQIANRRFGRGDDDDDDDDDEYYIDYDALRNGEGDALCANDGSYTSSSNGSRPGITSGPSPRDQTMRQTTVSVVPYHLLNSSESQSDLRA